MNNLLKFVFLTVISNFFFLLVHFSAYADEFMQRGTHHAQCIIAASQTYKVPTPLILILLRVEGGNLGNISQNTNNTVDIGPMQINQIWIKKVAEHWKTTPKKAASFLENNFCANIEAGTWILSKNLEEAKGDIWKGVGYYHSHNPILQDLYLRKVLKATIDLYNQSKRNL